MKKITLLIAFMLSLVTMGYGQTVLINPAAEGGFANGATFAANGWTAANSANNPWVIGTAAVTGSMTGNAAYVSNDAGVTTNYTNSVAAVNYFYRDITVPAGETKIVLTFNWTGTGEDNWDHWQVLTAPTTVIPTASTSSASNFSGSPVPAGVTGATSIGFGSPQTGVQTATYSLPAALAGTTFRLIFSWRDDTSGGVNPAAAIDNISLTSMVPFNAIASGNWNNPSTWNKGVVPSCTDDVNIVGGFNVTVNSAASVSKSINIASGSTLTVASGDLTVGCTLNNNLFVNNGTLTVTGGTLNINGNMLHAAGSTFNQSGGDINVDGNNGGAAATSVAAGTSIVQLNSQLINWTGGMLTIVDPHANATSTDSFNYNNSTANANAGSGHTLRFGNGVSTDAGGSSTYGFRMNTFPGSNRFAMGGNLIVNGGSGTNRFVTTSWGIGFVNVTITAGSAYRDGGNTTYISGNILNNGTLASTGIVYFGTFLNGTAGVTANAQTVSGTGVFANATSSPTANFTSVTINNNNASGVSFVGTNNIASQPANSVSVSGTLTLTAGKVATTGGASFILGNSTPSAGTLSYTAGGFVSGTTFGRWFTATGAGTTITAAADATGAGGRYPFVNASNIDRSASIERNTAAAAAGILAVTYTAVPGYSVISATDGATAIDRKGNDTWAVSVLSGTPTAAASLELQLLGSGTFAAPLTAANTRIIQGAAFAGTHQAGTVTPGGQRVLSPAEIVAGPFSLATPSADLPFVSVASGDWNTPATWSTGVVPTCTDVVNIGAGHTVTVTTAGAVSKNLNIVSGGALTVSAGDLTVGCTLKNNTFSNSGTFTVSGGTVNVNGNMLHVAGSTFNQSGGNINVDGNDAGNAANSVASGTSIVQLNSQFINWTGGTLTVVDPHANSTASNTFTYTNSIANVDVTTGHTLRFGDGVSTDAGGNTTNGFRISTFAGSNRISFNNVIINGATGTNRFVSTTYGFGTNGDFTVNANSEFRDTGVIIYVAKNLVNNGNYVATGTLYFGTFLNATAGASANAQTLSGSGTFANLAASPTANLTSMTVNNSNATGVTLSKSISVSGTLTLTLGKVVTTTANLLTLGTTTAAGTLSGGGTTAYISGPFARTIASGNANTNYITFPVGKAAYAPVFLAPTTTAITVMKAEAFDTNTGTADPGITNLPANRRWEAPIVSGTVTDVKVRLGDANITATKIPVMAPTAAGIYNSYFGSTATYTAGTPNTVQGLNAVTLANYTGFLSFAESNICSGTPAPGNTIASVNNICLGTSVTFSVQNNTGGTGVTYQWQSSVNGTAFTDISGATSATYATVPSAALYYRLNVTCATGPATGTSTPVQIAFSNPAPTSTTPATRCGQGTVTLTAAGAGILNWYTAATGGVAVATGGSFTTPALTATTNYYVSTGTPVPSSLITLGTSTGTLTDGGTSPYYHGWGGVKTQYIIKASELSDAGIIAGPINSIAFTIGTVGTAVLNNFTVSMGTTTQSVATTTHVDGLSPVYTNAAQTLTAGVNTYTFSTPFNWNGTSNIVLQVCYSNENTGGTSSSVQYYTPGFVCSTYTYADNKTAAQICPTLTGTVDGSGGTSSSSNRPKLIINGTSLCAGARTLVTATVNTPPAFTLSGNPAPICAGQTTAAVTITAGAADYNTYVWTPSTGVSGNATSGWTFNPAVSTSYSLQASQSGGSLCIAAPVTVNVVVNALPTAASISATPVVVCEGQSQPLTLTGGISLQTGAIGNGTTAPGATTYPNPFSAFYGGTKTQILFKATELQAMGMVSGNTINALSFDFFASSAFALTDMQIRVGSTTNVDLTAGVVPSGGLTTVYNGTYTPTANATGLVAFNFTSGYTYTGGNLIVEIVHNASNGGNGSGTRTNTTTTTFDSVFTQAKDNVAGGVPGFDAASGFSINTASTSRPNIVFNYSVVNPVTWAPQTELYTDAATTIPYTGQNLKTVYVKPTAAHTYTATATTAASCTISASVNVTVNIVPAPTVAAATQDICNAGTVADLVATGTAIKWYAGSVGGTALAPTTALVNGTPYYASQTVGGCESVARVSLTPNINIVAAPTVADANPVFCNAATVADLLPNGPEIKWYAGTAGGSALLSTDALVSGTPYYASQTVNGCEGLLRATVTPTINTPAAPAVADVNPVFCNAATVADLLPNDASIKWYAGTVGGSALLSTDALVNGTPYYASQTIDGCEGLARTEVTVTVNVTPAPTGDDEQEFCTSATIADLAATGDNITWYDAETDGIVLTGDIALTDGTVYYASQTIDGCEGLVRFGVTAVIHTVVADAPEDVNVCTEYVLPALTSGAYFTEAGGTGAEVAAGTAITETTTLYVYAQEGTDIVCSDENSFMVTVANVEAPTGDATQTITADVAAEATISDLVTDTVTGTVTWYASEEDAQTGTNALAGDTQLEQGATYYATQTIGECTSIEVFAVTVDVVLDRDNFDVKAFTYHPNPVKDILNLSYSSEITSVTVFNLLGQRVIAQQANATDVKIDMSSLADGAYVVNVTSGNTVKTIKVIKKQ